MASPTSPYSDSPSPPRSRSNRQQSISYADLMKPDEDWRNLPNPADRRKIQNRLAQRAYRRSLRERNQEVKLLKKQLEMLEESRGLKGSGSPGHDREFPGATSNPDSPPQATAGPSTPLSPSISDGIGDYLQGWPQTSEPEHNFAYWGVGFDQLMSPDFDLTAMEFDTVSELSLSRDSKSAHSVPSRTSTGQSYTHDSNSNTCLSPSTPEYLPFGMDWHTSMNPMMSTSDPHFGMDVNSMQGHSYYSPGFGASPPQYIDPMLSMPEMTPGKKSRR